MRSNNCNGSRAASARGFMAFCAIVLAMGLGAMATPAEAAPFAYVANFGSPPIPGTVSVIDTATNTVVATVGVGHEPSGVAVTPDGKHVYVTNFDFPSNNVSVIDAATNMVVATIQVGIGPLGVAISPDGKHAYVTSNYFNFSVFVIDTTTNTVVATIPVGANPSGVAVTPDGQHVYVANNNSRSVSVIDTATNTVVGAPIPSGDPTGVAVAPDGKHVYVTNEFSNNVSVIDTATNTVEVATIQVGVVPTGVAVTPDGKHVYVANWGDGTVSVIDTATNTVVATVTVGSGGGGGRPGMGPNAVAITPDGKHVYVASGSGNVSVIDTANNMVVATVVEGAIGVGSMPPPAGVPFLAFSAKLAITFGGAPNEDSFNLHSPFTLSSTAPALHPHRDPVTLQVGTFSITIPPRSFREQPDGSFTFAGVISGVSLKAQIYHTGTLQYEFHAKAMGASLTGAMKPVYVTLIIGGDMGVTPVKNLIFY